MERGAAAGGGSLTEHQRDELFLFRWLFGIGFRELDERIPDWEREVLLERAVEWLPRILRIDGDEQPQAAPQPTFEALPLDALGISTTTVSVSAAQAAAD